jgi:1,3-beta-glucan synthase
MTTGYKRRRLGLPSEKLSGDFMRPSLKALLFSEIIFPICIAVIFVIAYMFVKSFPDPTAKYPPSPLIRIAVISLGPIALNAAVLVALFLVSLFLGPILEPTFPKFGSSIAFIAHVVGVLGIIGFSEILVSTNCDLRMSLTDYEL